MRHILTAAALLAPAAAHAQTPAPAPTYAVPVESFALGKAKGPYETSFAAGDYLFSSKTELTVKDFSAFVLVESKVQLRVAVTFQFAHADGTPVLRGTCAVTSKMVYGLWNATDNSAYACPADRPDADSAFTLEAQVPNVAPSGGTGLMISRDDPAMYKVLKARMRYAGALYEALPTGFNLSEADYHRRVATGYAITRDGKPVGRIDFPERKGFVMDVNGSFDRKSVITAPTSAADGREAVILFAAQLFALPEANSPASK
ncbi:MAG: hypothetical protein KGN34_06855 [Sphingomonadales bacterium]|nr:hypothetical protein [Sphingomonadales bacterium]